MPLGAVRFDDILPVWRYPPGDIHPMSNRFKVIWIYAGANPAKVIPL
jgi:hypothetical protein